MVNPRKQPVTLEDVSLAMQQLLEEGIDPSVRTVRERIGRGSMTTITKFVEQARAGLNSAADVVATFPAALEGLCLQMVEAINTMAAQTVAEQRGHVEVMRKHVQEQAADAELQVNIAKQQLANETRLNKELWERIYALEEQARQNDSRITEFQTEKLHQQIALNGLQQLSESLEKDNQRLTEYIKNYEHQSAELLSREKAESGRRIALLESECRALRGEIINANTENRSLTERNAALEIQAVKLEGRCMAAEQKRDSLEALVAELSVIESNLGTKVAALENKLDDAARKADRLNQSKDELTQELIRRQAKEEQRNAENQTAFEEATSGLALHGQKLIQFIAANIAGMNDNAKVELAELKRSQQEIDRHFLKPA